MNEFQEFCKAWRQEFPGQDLPTVWEEDTRANLLRHKKNLEYLQSEVRKEEFYVKFLESVLSNAINRKTAPSSTSPDALSSVSTSAEATTSEAAQENLDSLQSDFVTVISINNKLANLHEVPKQPVDKPKAPPKPAKQYSRSVSSDSPSRSKPEDLIAWTKQQIQQLQAKQSLKYGELSVSPTPSAAAQKQSYENVSELGQSKRVSYENVRHPKGDYENVMNDFSIRCV